MYMKCLPPTAYRKRARDLNVQLFLSYQLNLSHRSYGYLQRMLLNLFVSRWFFMFSHVDNPIAIVLAFTVGAVVNRRRRCRRAEEEPCTSAPLLGQDKSPSCLRPSFLPDNTMFRLNITSTLLASFPFLIEIWYWLLTYWVSHGTPKFKSKTCLNSHTNLLVLTPHILFAIMKLFGLSPDRAPYLY